MSQTEQSGTLASDRHVETIDTDVEKIDIMPETGFWRFRGGRGEPRIEVAEP